MNSNFCRSICFWLAGEQRGQPAGVALPWSLPVHGTGCGRDAASVCLVVALQRPPSHGVISGGRAHLMRPEIKGPQGPLAKATSVC